MISGRHSAGMVELRRTYKT